MSTGPQSDEGKTHVSRNAWRGGEWQKLREMSKLLQRLWRSLTRQIEAAFV